MANLFMTLSLAVYSQTGQKMHNDKEKMDKLDIKTEKFCVSKNTKKVKKWHIFNRMKENICNHIW